MSLVQMLRSFISGLFEGGIWARYNEN
jgi:hypothetical protein